MGRTRSRNLLDATPKRNLRWEVDDNGFVVLVVPRFTNPLAVKWLVPHLKRPEFRLKLDALGTFVWNGCDGLTSVSTIAENMRREFGEKAEPVFERVVAFISKLERERFLVLVDNDVH